MCAQLIVLALSSHSREVGAPLDPVPIMGSPLSGDRDDSSAKSIDP